MDVDHGVESAPALRRGVGFDAPAVRAGTGGGGGRAARLEELAEVDGQRGVVNRGGPPPGVQAPQRAGVGPSGVSRASARVFATVTIRYDCLSRLKVCSFWGHLPASKERSKRWRPAEITGVILRPDGLYAPNRLHKKLHDVRRELGVASSDDRRATLKAKVRGREAQMKQVTGW